MLTCLIVALFIEKENFESGGKVEFVAWQARANDWMFKQTKSPSEEVPGDTASDVIGLFSLLVS